MNVYERKNALFFFGGTAENAADFAHEHFAGGRLADDVVQRRNQGKPHGEADDWQDDAFPFRQRALNEAPKEIGFSREVIARGLDDFFAQITKKNLEDLIVQDLGHINRLDEMTATDLNHFIPNPGEIGAHIPGKRFSRNRGCVHQQFKTLVGHLTYVGSFG